MSIFPIIQLECAIAQLIDRKVAGITFENVGCNGPSIETINIMRCTVLFIGLLGFAVMVKAQNNLEVKIDNIKNDRGDILIGLYSDGQNFPREVIDGRVVRASKDGVIVAFQDLKPGPYAISVLHDENSNKDMDQNKIGIPKEGFGFSNNAKSTFGPPSFDKAKFQLVPGQKDTHISIDLRYMVNKKRS